MLEDFMQTTVRRLLFAIGIGLLGVSGVLAAPGAPSSQSAATLEQQLVEPAQWGGRYCERLRRACVYKEYRGEVGEGNCRRYRAECLSRESYCERLRRACVYKEY